PEDQYSIDMASRVWVNGGIGNDWGIFRVFDNTQTGLQPVVAQGGGYFHVRQDLAPPTIRITGYGVDTGTSNQTQQTHTGPNAGSSGTTMRYQVDTTGGNSGSPVIDEATGDALGVHTHGGCSTSGSGSNSGTSLFNTAFWAAVGTPPPPASEVCFTTLSGGLTASIDLDEPRDIFYGVGNGATTYQVSGGRGTNGRTLRHHYFDFMNPAAGDSPTCTDNDGIVDWLVFNGRVTGGGGGTYSWGGRWMNSCGTTGSTTGTITLGGCPAPRQAVPDGDDAQRVPPARVRADVPLDEAATSLVAALPEGGLTYCYTNSSGYQHEGTIDNATDILSGLGDTGSGFDWYVHGGRGTTGRELRHHALVWQNPNANNDSGCGDGSGFTDWFTYNGLVSGSGPSYTFNTVWRNSCNATGTSPGTITVGPCPAPLAGSPRPGPEAIAPSAAAGTEVALAGAEVAPAGVAVVSGPNPFRSSTTIMFALAEATHVRLAVYDMLGREIAVLVDEEREAGTHSAVFEAGALPSGTYLYRIEAGSHTEAKPMVLVR
ncbi:MAG TPA: T9SS type A sorting domain-containing protein, partial [Rubricoccaceae bacterium]|nr:T9SS type A sorting domain-containing protein [Rubricoccaceae bacterium]